MGRYELIDHTADVGIKVYGQDLKEIFEIAARATFEIIADLKNVKPREKICIELKGSATDELLVSWLSELLSQYDAYQILFSKFSVDKISQSNIFANAYGQRFDKKLHEIKTEIKAATYHDLKVEKVDSGWQAQIIFDL